MVEVLIALAVMAMLITSVFAGIRFAAKAWSASAAQTNEDEQVAAIRRYLTRAISQAYPAFADPAITDSSVAFEGTPRTLTFVAPLPQAAEIGVMAIQRLALQQDGSGPALILAWRPDLADPDGRPVPDQVVVLGSDIASLQFSYFGPVSDQRPDDPELWQDHWSNRASLPTLVRVAIAFADPHAPPWQDLVVRPRTTNNTACFYDAKYMTCRRLR